MITWERNRNWYLTVYAKNRLKKKHRHIYRSIYDNQALAEAKNILQEACLIIPFSNFILIRSHTTLTNLLRIGFEARVSQVSDLSSHQ